MPITPLDQWPDPNNFTTFTQKYAQNMALIEAFVNGLEGTVEGKAASSHTHNYAPSSHNHTIAQVTGLQTALNGKEATLNTDQKRKITISTSNPSGGANGDIWIKV